MTDNTLHYLHFGTIMSDNFNTFINHIEPNYWRELCVKEGKLHHFERGEEFAKVGEVACYIGYVKSGSLKYVAYSPDGTEHVVGMVFEGEFVADYPFSLFGTKAMESIIAATPCEIHCLPVRKVIKQMENDARVKDIVLRSAEAVFSTVYERYINLHCKTPQQRYEELVRRHHDLFSHFSLKDIASFLNITPIHLSRIRKKSR